MDGRHRERAPPDHLRQRRFSVGVRAGAAGIRLGYAAYDQSEGPIRRGRGLAALVEPSGLGPFEGARIEIDRQGFVHVASGEQSQGQGHETVLAQVASSVLTVPIERINVRHGDTGLIQFGGGSYASRTAVMSGHAVHAAAMAVKDKAIRVAAASWRSPRKISGSPNGRVSLSVRRSSILPLGAIARMLSPGNPELSGAAQPGEHRRQ